MNAASKRHPVAARCHCGRFAVSPAIGDTEAFIGRSLSALVSRQGLALEPVEADELLQVMRVALWRASRKYDSRSHIRFGSFAATFLVQRAIDELRSARMFGRRGQHRLPLLPPPAIDDGGQVVGEEADPEASEELWVSDLDLRVAIGGPDS